MKEADLKIGRICPVDRAFSDDRSGIRTCAVGQWCYHLKMEQKQRLFIYDRREVVILVTLGLTVATFAFTLGVHLGKKVTSHSLNSPTAEVPQTATLQDNLPNKQELTEQARSAQAAADEELSHTLHEEVEKVDYSALVHQFSLLWSSRAGL